MIRQIEQLLSRDGWAGIYSRTAIELTFFVAVFYAGEVITWLERVIWGRVFIIDKHRESILVYAAGCIIVIGLTIELINAIRLVVASRRTHTGR